MEPARKVHDRFLSIPQAARALDVANATIPQMILRGEIEGEIVAGRTVVTRESVTRALTRRNAERTDRSKQRRRKAAG